MPFLFLDQTDYISRAHEIEISPSSVRPPRVRVTIISESNARIAFKFYLWLPQVVRFGPVLIFWNEYFSFSLTWDPMGAKISKRYSSYKSKPKVFKLFLNFPANGPHKTTFGIRNLENWILRIFFSFSLTWDPMGMKIFKTLLLLQIANKSFQTCTEFFPQWSQKWVGDFWNLDFVIFSSGLSQQEVIAYWDGLLFVRETRFVRNR